MNMARALIVILRVVEFPVFADLYRQMKAADKDYAAAAMKHYKSFLIGPPNHRTEDRYGLLEVGTASLYVTW